MLNKTFRLIFNLQDVINPRFPVRVITETTMKYERLNPIVVVTFKNANTHRSQIYRWVIRMLVASNWHQYVHTNCWFICISRRTTNKNPSLNHIGFLHPTRRIFSLNTCGRQTHDRDNAIKSWAGDCSLFLTIDWVRKLEIPPVICKVVRDHILKKEGRLLQHTLMICNPGTVTHHDRVKLILKAIKRCLISSLLRESHSSKFFSTHCTFSSAYCTATLEDQVDRQGMSVTDALPLLVLKEPPTKN